MLSRVRGPNYSRAAEAVAALAASSASASRWRATASWWLPALTVKAAADVVGSSMNSSESA